MRFISAILIAIFSFVQIITAQLEISIPQKFITTSTGSDVDDCAIWVHPTTPSKSLVIINDKSHDETASGLYTYNLNGKLIQKISLHRPQNPDIRYNVVFGKDTMDVLVCSDREAGNSLYNKIRVFKIDPAKAEDTSGFLTEITTLSGIPTGLNETYGHSLYKRPSDGALFSIVSDNGNSNFVQIRLQSDGSGKVKGTPVRSWGGSDIKGDVCEGICCDDELGFIYICDEDVQILKYHADPDKNINTLVASFALDDGIQSDREGINIYRCDNNSGYILLSSQGNNQIKVYDRITNKFLGTVLADGMKDCDGLDVTAVPLGPQFPHGMAAFHLGSSAGSQFGFYDWSDIATGLQLATPCDTKRPETTAKVSTAKQKNNVQKSLRVIPDIYFALYNIHMRNMPVQNGIVDVVILDIQGRQTSIHSVSDIHNGEAIIPLDSPELHPGLYIINCKVNGQFHFNDLLTIQ